MMKEEGTVIEMKGVFIEGVFIDEPVQGLARKGILETIRNSRRRGLSVIELTWITGADIFLILRALKQLRRANLIFVRKRHAVHWCFSLREVA